MVVPRSSRSDSGLTLGGFVLYRAKLKNEKKQLLDSVEALSKRVERLEQRNGGTAVKQQPASGFVASAASSSTSGQSPVTSTAAATTPDYSSFAEPAPIQYPPNLNLARMPRVELRDVHRLFGINHGIQSKFSYTASPSC